MGCHSLPHVMLAGTVQVQLMICEAFLKCVVAQLVFAAPLCPAGWSECFYMVAQDPDRMRIKAATLLRLRLGANREERAPHSESKQVARPAQIQGGET